MKSALVVFAITLFALNANASPIRIKCDKVGNKAGSLDVVVDSKALTRTGENVARVKGMYENQSIISARNPVTKRIQLTLKYQTGRTMTIVEARTPVEASVLWGALPRPFLASSRFPATSKEAMFREYGRQFPEGITRNVYLMLYNDSFGDVFSFAGFCRLSYAMPASKG